MILDEILKNKSDEVESQKRTVPLEEVRSRLNGVEPARDFGVALGKPGMNLIAEIKKASPSAGVFREDLVPGELAREYESGGASAISVITDFKYFRGKTEYLDEVRSAVDLPILRKEFIIDEYQIYEARAHGADAVLLIVAALDEDRLRRFIETAAGLDMSCLVEVHDEREMETALEVDAAIIGINNRNLRTFETTLTTTERLRPMVPEGKIVVSESGIKTHEDVEHLMNMGVNAVLIGETLVRSRMPAQTIRMLLKGQPRR